MVVLITGAAGLIGSRLSDWLIKNIEDIQVIGVDDLSGGYKENLNEKIIFFQIDCKDSQLENIFSKYKPDYVFHLAAYAAEGLSPFIRKFNYENNLTSTANIINQCINFNVKRLVFTSSLAVYGHGNYGIFDESQIPKPIDPYGVAKFACEMDIQIAGDQHNLDWCIIRPHNVYGVNQNIWDRYRNVLGIWMYQHLNNEPMTIFGDGLQTRAFSFVDDNLLPFWNAAIKSEASKQIINVGGIEEISIIDANRTLIKIIGSGDVVFKEERHEVKHSIPTWKKSVEILNYKYETTLENGLVEMWNWAKQQPQRSRFIWDKYEIEKGIYSFWKNDKNL
jgi:UDP-glucose 4-epimerase